MSRKNKFDLTRLVHDGLIAEGAPVAFVSDPKKTAIVTKQPNGEFKLKAGPELLTVHAFAQKCLGQEPPNHAAQWLRAPSGKTLYELWQGDDGAQAA